MNKGSRWGGSDAPVQFPLSSLQQRILKNSDTFGAGEGQDCLPALQKQGRRAAVGSFLCSDLKEELGERFSALCPTLGLPSGQRQLMIGEPVASARELQRYKELLLEKQRELSSVQGDAAARLPAAGGLEGDIIDQANANAEAELQIRLHQTDARLLRAIEEALARIKQGTFGVCQACKQPVSKARLEAVPWSRHCRDCKEHEQSNGAAEGRS